MDKLKIGVIGAGTMGSGIAQVFAANGHETLLFDADPQMVSKAKKGHSETMSKLVEKGKISKEVADKTLSHLKYIASPGEFSECGLVIEAIIENLDIKQKLFNDIEKIVDEDCILGTNTSSLSVTSIASVCNKPERVIGIHFFNPAPLMPLVEIVKGVTTIDTTEKKTKEIIDALGKSSVLAKDTPGFIVNRIARPYYGEAIRIHEEGIADFATIDAAMKDHGFKMGPFELMDLIGNDINYTVTETVWSQFFFDARYKPSLTQKRLFEAKRFGRKSGQGYYSYLPGSEIPAPLKDNVLAEKIFMRILSMLINEAADALYLGVASREDIDLAMTKGVNYPKGLLKWCDEIGGDKILAELAWLKEEYSEERYRPSVLLKKIVKEKRKFY
ncbi:MAG: 3-hydroxyacyl-CoA dehydrogenase NAD-binding domain-containing protein [Bacteroidetes bacterium]|nr:3-hydroxyacyl-CoA dehydrogenase NAD-binding domain-containing protein [Bacteroidota bacterium]